MLKLEITFIFKEKLQNSIVFHVPFNQFWLMITSCTIIPQYKNYDPEMGIILLIKIIDLICICQPVPMALWGGAPYNHVTMEEKTQILHMILHYLQLPLEQG